MRYSKKIGLEVKDSIAVGETDVFDNNDNKENT